MKNFSIILKVFVLIILILAVLNLKVNAVTITFYEVRENVNFRAGPSTSETNYAQLMKGEKVLVDESKETTNWHCVTYEEVGFIYKTYINSSKKTTTDVNFREGSATSTRKKARILKGQTVEILGKVGNWYKVKYKRTGYIHKNYLEKIIEVKVNTTSASKIDLKLREKPTTSSKIIDTIKHGTYIYTTQNKLINTTSANGLEWVSVRLLDGKEGYVAKKYLEVSSQAESKDDDNNNSNYKCVEVDMPYEGTIKGYLGIDIVPGSMTENEFVDIITGKKLISNKYVGDFKPEYVFFKLGATGWGSTFSISKALKTDQIIRFAKICEDNKVPYGFYYFSQAINKTEANREIEYIKDTLNTVNNSLGSVKYQVLPLAIDVEYGGDQTTLGRMAKFINNGGSKSDLANVKDHIMNEVNKITNVNDTILYTDINTLRGLIEFKNMSEENKEMWVADPIQYTSHAKRLTEDGYFNYIKVRQVALDFPVYSRKYVDINLMNKEFFEPIVKEL